MAFPKEGFRIASVCLPNIISALDVKGAAAAVRGLRHRLEPGTDLSRGGRFAVSLIDGLANVEETVVSTVAWALDGIPMVGGSAGDDLAFPRRPRCLHERRHVVRNGADHPSGRDRFSGPNSSRADNFDPTEHEASW